MSNYRICGGSHIGSSHERSGTVCQDAHYYFARQGFVVAAVADGLGSSKHSDIASKIAVKSAVDFCAERIVKRMRDRDILTVISTAFDNANFAIKQVAGDDLDDYDTTLTLAILVQGDLFFGHAGDSGLIALRKDGLFEEVTQPQLGEGTGKDRPVYPLAAQSKWVFGKYPHPTHAIFLMTDGVLNKVVPPLLENQVYTLDNAYLFYLYDNLRRNPNISSWINGEIAQILPQEVNYDDITIVAALCKSVRVKFRRKEYYEFPSAELWSSLLEEHKNRLYAYKAEGVLPEEVFKIPVQVGEAERGFVQAGVDGRGFVQAGEVERGSVQAGDAGNIQKDQAQVYRRSNERRKWEKRRRKERFIYRCVLVSVALLFLILFGLILVLIFKAGKVL